MANMSYCEVGMYEDDISKEEHYARRRLIELCKDIAHDYGDIGEFITDYKGDDE